MTNEEREAFLSQQRQNEYNLDFLANEDPSLYKAVMDKQAAEFSEQPPMSGFGTLTGLDKTYQSGETRMNFIESQRDRPVSPSDQLPKLVGGGEYGMGVGDFFGGGFVDAFDGWEYLKGASQRNRDARALLTQELVDEGYSTGSIDFYKEFTKRLPEPEGSGEALFDVGVGVVEGITLGAAKPVTAALKFIVKGDAARFLKGLSAKLTGREAPLGRGALPTANNAVPADTPQFGALAAQQQQLDDIDDDFIPFEDIRIDTTQPMDIVQTTPEERPQGEILFSPSLRAARELKQEKGSYEQIRATMIKNGAKTDELEWSGADDMFSGKKVTKDEIIDYLEKNDPRLIPNISKADGVLGSVEAMDMREAVDAVMEDRPAVSQWMSEEQDFLEGQLYDRDYFSPTELVDEDLERLAVEMGTNPDDLRRKEWAYKDEDGNIEFFNYSDDALAHMYGGRDNLNEELERSVRLRLEDEYDNDPPNFMSLYRVDNPNALDAGDTQYSEYFPEGGADYSENLFQYRDPTERIGIDVIAGSKHFGRQDAGTIFHTRHADYVDENGDTVRYVGEIQSDPQQSITESDAITSYGQSLQEENMSALRYDIKLIEYEGIKKQEDVFTSQMDEFELSKLMHEASIFRLNQDLKNPNSYNAGKASELGVEGEIPFSGEMTDAQETLLNGYISAGGNLYRGRSWVLSKDAQDKVYEYLVGSEVDWLPDDVKQRVFDIVDDTANRRQELQRQIVELEKQAYTGDVAQGNKILKPGGPFMTSQNKWLDEALRRSIYDAVNDPDVDYLSFPNDPDAIAKVGGRDVAKEGTINYYQRDVQNRLKKLLKSFSKDVNVDTINIGSGEVGSNSYFSSKGFKITPEFRESVLKKGIPTYAVPLAVGAGSGYGALNQVGGQDGESGG
jgi:hypothetical protein